MIFLRPTNARYNNLYTKQGRSAGISKSPRGGQREACIGHRRCVSFSAYAAGGSCPHALTKQEPPPNEWKMPKVIRKNLETKAKERTAKSRSLDEVQIWCLWCFFVFVFSPYSRGSAQLCSIYTTLFERSHLDIKTLCCRLLFLF